jgi:hypothetical protein
MLLDRHLIISRARCNAIDIIGINSAETGERAAKCYLLFQHMLNRD